MLRWFCLKVGVMVRIFYFIMFIGVFVKIVLSSLYWGSFKVFIECILCGYGGNFRDFLLFIFRKKEKCIKFLGKKRLDYYM